MADYEQLEEEIKKIIELVEKLPEAYRITAFEVLLNSAVRSAGPATVPIAATTETKPEITTALSLPIDVKAFLVQYNLPEDAISRLFLIHGSEIRPVYKITEGKYSTAQMQIALLAALENALRGTDTKFEFSFEQVRTLCKRYNKYDSGNFTTNFKSNKKLFVGLSNEDQIEPSPDGKDALADLIADLLK